MSLDECLDELAKNYVFVSQSKVERAKIQIAAMNYIKHFVGSNTNRGTILRRVWFDRVDYYREIEREQKKSYDIYNKEKEGC